MPDETVYQYVVADFMSELNSLRSPAGRWGLGTPSQQVNGRSLTLASSV
jgi:hypothetical protein